MVAIVKSDVADTAAGGRCGDGVSAVHPEVVPVWLLL